MVKCWHEGKYRYQKFTCLTQFSPCSHFSFPYNIVLSSLLLSPFFSFFLFFVGCFLAMMIYLAYLSWKVFIIFRIYFNFHIFDCDFFAYFSWYFVFFFFLFHVWHKFHIIRYMFLQISFLSSKNCPNMGHDHSNTGL